MQDDAARLRAQTERDPGKWRCPSLVPSGRREHRFAPGYRVTQCRGAPHNTPPSGAHIDVQAQASSLFGVVTAGLLCRCSTSC